MSLADLNERVRADLAALDHGAPDWTRPRTHASGEHVYDVLIVGGGQSGLGAAFGLMRERISNILVIDENPAGQEGPWITYARMVTLRTPKQITSIDLGIPSLTFRAFWEAQHGTEGWEAIGKIPRGDWMDYLRWYREVLDLPVRNEVRLTRIEPQENGVHRLHVEGAGAPASGILLARKVVLATGIQGGGEWHTPPMIAEKLPRSRYAHTSEAVDYAALAGKSIGILGGGASAFDNAQFALGQGVAEAHVYVRRQVLPRVNPIRYMEASGLIGRFTALDDAAKYAVMASFMTRNQPPTNDTFERAAAWPGFALHLGSPWLDVEETPAGVVVTTPKGRFTHDFLVLSTGLVTDPALRPELGLVAGDIARWRDRYSPPVEIANPVVDDHPYLGPSFEYLSDSAEGQARLHGLFAFNYSGLISLGISASALSGLKYAIPKLVNGIAGQLFLDDREAALAAYHDYAEPEFLGEWTPPAEALRA
ncbi:monooxygenase [Sphingomonas oleivorans]|uniref:Monooxygenase n=1 Tax=Sphingomonas oleivorans TaxID=1735121 RepID=A0A2T5FYD0_9SPHN|nr:NAD(P)/FAD-dependent oxidoreductase [Sphingomonas oleivorans]PTQ11526.1 monooxygenase [Sphingomonas oleivorans]